MTKHAALALVALALPLAAPPSGAQSAGRDILVLKDSRIFDGVRLKSGQDGITIHYEHGQILVPHDLVLDALIEDQPSWEPSTDEEREKAEKGLVPFEGKWIPRKRRDDLIAKRIEEKREQVADMQACRLWRNRHITETKHFRFEFTVPEHLFAPLRDKMEAYFSAFAKDWRVKQPRGLGKLPICFYNDRDAFRQTSGAGGGVLGYFRFVEPMELDFFFDRLDMELTEEVMYHETNHYLQKLIDVDFSYPHFPGESVAEYYGASRYEPETKKFSTGLVLEGRLAEVKRDVMAGEMMGLRKLIATEGLYDHYTWGWTLVHFLMGDPKTNKAFKKFMLALPQDKDVKRVSRGFGNLKTCTAEEVLRVFMDRMDLESEEDLLALEERWHVYVKEQLDFVSARGLELAAVSAQRAGMPIKAKSLFGEAIEQGTTNPMTFHHYAELLERDGDRAGAISQWRRAIELDPLGAEYYLSMGEAMYHSGDEAQGLQRMRLAREIDPDVISWGFDLELLEELEGE